ncbi:MAG: hypothetical protein ACM30I_06555 [Gemmatimonas sp.]
MTAPTEIYINAFTRLSLDGVRLGEMQVANPRLTYPLADAASVIPEIDIAVRLVAEQPFARSVFDSPETGYFERGGGFYYRNCNFANAMHEPDVFYMGRLPNSFGRVRIECFEPLRIVFTVTKTFVWESRSRLTRFSSIDEAVNNVALAAAVLRGYLPFHGAAIEAGPADRRFSLIFMGLPNTGKTSTSVATRKALGGDYLAEDICFVRADTLDVLAGPYTLDETKIQNYDELRAAKYRGAKLAAIVMLDRSDAPSSLSTVAAGDASLRDFILGMNRYEFEWNHDMFVRHLMIGGERGGFTIPAITNAYFGGLARVADRTPAIRLSGVDPTQWAGLLVAELAKRGLASR